MASLVNNELITMLEQKAERELNEKLEWRQRDIQALRDLVVANKALKSRLDDGFLLCFLRAKKFDYDRAYSLLVNYYMLRAENNSLFHNLKPSCIAHVLNDRISAILPYRTPDGCKILYFRSGLWTPENYPIWDIMKANVMSLEAVLAEEETQICGVVAIHNMSGVGWRHIKHIDQKAIKLMLRMLQDAFPLRFKGMHLVNEPAIFSYAFSLVRPFVKEKLASRMHFHGSNLTSLQKHFNLSVLPEELGGSLPSGNILAEQWAAQLQAKEAIFDEMTKYGFLTGETLFAERSQEGVCTTLSY